MTEATSPLSDQVPDPEVYRRRRSYTDLYARSLVGPMYYIVACLMLLFIGGLGSVALAVTICAAVMFLALWRLRYTNRLPVDFTDEQVCARWSRRQWGSIHAGYILWGLVTVVVTLDQGELNNAVFTASLAISMFGNAASTVFTVNSTQQRITLAALHWPIILVLAIFPQFRVLALVLFLHWIWCGLSATKLASEYRVQVELEYALLVSRAEVQALARTDALTGLANRHEYVSRLNWAWLSAQRNKSPLVMAVIDLDHFKVVNDVHGHLAGDVCLKHVAGLLKHHFRRADDFVARIGGEEFVAILPSTTIEVGLRMCEEFRLALAASVINFEDKSIKMTTSIGVGIVTPSAEIKPDASFARIDAATYEAKSRGRNQTVIAANIKA